MQERLSKILSGCGVASRRQAEKIIIAGKVQVDGVTIYKPEHHCDLAVADIVVEGKKLHQKEEKKTFVLHKPKGYVCTNVRLRPSQKIIIDLFPNFSTRLFTVGRLDKDTEGLLIVTNDGLLTTLIHPRNGIEKEYIVKTNTFLQHEHLVKLSKPVYIDGRRVQPIRVKKIRKNTFSITVGEGKKHEVRILSEKAGLKVIAMKRIRIGNLLLGQLKKGDFRPFTLRDKKALLHNARQKSC